jgi:aspartate carbamoyltransferase regulatory subunit
LKREQVNSLDDGRVIDHVSADDVAQVEDVEHRVIAEAHQEERDEA